MADWYRDAYIEYCSRAKSVEAVTEFLKKKTVDNPLREAEVCISIGPSKGITDLFLLSHVMKKCKHYYGVEPDPVNVEDLKKQMSSKFPHIKSDINQAGAEDWAGPDQKADVILLFHVLYYVKDPQAVISKCAEWLKPGGCIVNLQCDKNNFYRVSKELIKVKRESDRTQDDIEGYLKALGMKYKVDRIEFPYNMSHMNQPLANFYYQKVATADEVTALKTFLEDNYPSGKETLVDCLTYIRP